MIKRDLFVAQINIKQLSCWPVLVLLFLPLYNKKSQWNGIRVELKEPEFESYSV